MSSAEEIFSINNTEPHIIIGVDRKIVVPDKLKRIAVQYDHNIETVTFDCPRYWDNHDMSSMIVYINYMRADGITGMYKAMNVRVDKTDETIIHFDWTITRNVSEVKGMLHVLVCVKNIDGDGNEQNHWNSELCKDMYVSEGMECSDFIIDSYPDVITQILTKLNANQSGGGLNTTAINLLINILENGTYQSDQNANIESLREELKNNDPDGGETATAESITATFVQGIIKIYDTDPLAVLRNYLTVTATYSDGTAAETESYALSGELVAGVSTITVTYDGITTTFDVTVISASAVYTVTNTLTNVTNSNSATSANAGAVYNGILTADDGYALVSVIVTIGGVDVTADVYADGVIAITNVTGDINIIAEAVDAANVVYLYDGFIGMSGTTPETEPTMNSSYPKCVVTSAIVVPAYNGPYISTHGTTLTADTNYDSNDIRWRRYDSDGIQIAQLSGNPVGMNSSTEESYARLLLLNGDDGVSSGEKLYVKSITISDSYDGTVWATYTVIDKRGE